MKTYQLKINVGVSPEPCGLSLSPERPGDEYKSSTYAYQKFTEEIEFEAEGRKEAVAVTEKNVLRLQKHFTRDPISYELKEEGSDWKYP